MRARARFPSLAEAPHARVRPTRPSESANGFLRDVVEGLRRPQKAIPSKYFYDARGSALFDRICDLPEYYPTRTETAILAARAGEIAALAGPRAVLVEFGSGSSTKVRLLLDALDKPAVYVPIDISREHLLAAAGALARDYPALEVKPLVADFTRRLALPAMEGGHRIGFFPGSTIGNFTPADAATFLSEAGATLGPGAALIVGVDLKKDAGTLRAAYNDAQGVTAAFNLNLLSRMNRELGADFDLDGFAHEAIYDQAHGRVEMHLVSRRAQAVTLGGERFAFARGETVHTENSYKYGLEAFAALAGEAGWAGRHAWTDADGLFSVHYLTRD